MHRQALDPFEQAGYQGAELVAIRRAFESLAGMGVSEYALIDMLESASRSRFSRDEGNRIADLLAKAANDYTRFFGEDLSDRQWENRLTERRARRLSSQRTGKALPPTQPRQVREIKLDKRGYKLEYWKNKGVHR